MIQKETIPESAPREPIPRLLRLSPGQSVGFARVVSSLPGPDAKHPGLVGRAVSAATPR